MAMDFATTYPDRISHLCLLCPGGVVRENASFLWKALFYLCCGEWGKGRITKLVNGGDLPESEGLKDALEFTALIGQHLKPRTAKLPLFSVGALQRLTMPVQVVGGENDALIPPRQTIDRLSGIVENIDAVLLPDVGHVITGQAKKISRFLSSASMEQEPLGR
jgi:pimeloyl-ACP methyl ester carboxylesterase